VIWAKTEAGRKEIQARALVKERAQRNLLLVIDGVKTDEMLLASLAGISAADFQILRSLGLIEPVAPANPRGSVSASNRTAASTPVAPAAEAPLDYAQFTAALTQLISKELGLRGFVLTLAVEKASTIEELRAVAERAITQIGERKGAAVAGAARRTLFGA
jgi:hypothetical protein